MNIFDDREVRALNEKLEKLSEDPDFIVSDLILQRKGKTLQFVDLVMEGGGTLGIALVGYIYALEQAGIRFLSVGGSSVGAIVALLLACLGERTEKKGAALTEIITEMDMKSFIDGRLFPSVLSRLLGKGKVTAKTFKIIVLAIFSSCSIVKKVGLNPGNNFLEWLTSCLKAAGVRTVADARKVFASIPEDLTHRTRGQDYTKPSPSLKPVAADITTSTKVIFPEMAPLYWKDPEALNPAYLARASMSIPGFFQPMEVNNVSEIDDIKEKWKSLCSFDGKVPDKITFSDGGLLSNFPISLFHESRVPNAPTFGARLGSFSRVVKEISTFRGYIGNLFESMRHNSDFEFMYKNPDYRNLIAYIPTTGHNWLNFYMSDDEILCLFKNGMNAAYDFLENFDWSGYKEIRRQQLTMDALLSRLHSGRSRRDRARPSDDARTDTEGA